jgi:hypothetical protein
MNTTVQGHNAVGGATKRGAPDPSVPVPPGVKAQADRANALIEQAKTAKAANEAAGGNELVKPVVPEVRSNPNVMTADFDPRNPRPPDFNDPSLAHLLQAPQSRTTPPAPRADQSITPPPAPTPPQPQNEADWEHQFKSLKGRYDRETEDKRRLQQALIDQQRLLAQIGSPPIAPQGEGSGVRFNVAPPPPGRFVKPAEVQEYGQELIDVMGRRAAEVYEPIISQLAGELQNVKRQIGGVQNTVVFDARVKMYDDLSRTIPNWDAINNSPQFAAWLDQVDPISHQPRRNFLNAAHNSNSAGQVIDIFQSFLSAIGQGSPSGAGQPYPQGNGVAGNGAGNPAPSPQQFDLMQLAAPGRAKTGQTQVPPEKQMIRTSEIKQFYAEKTQGKWAGREAEAAAIERQIFDAGNENRIIRDK